MITPKENQKGIFVGKTATVTETVAERDTAKAIGSGSLAIFATPVMIALMERAACACLAESLEPGQTSVGTKVCAEHTAASPVGAEITVTAVVSDVEGRKISFDVTARDAKGEIGRGTHERVVVDGERFVAKAETRI